MTSKKELWVFDNLGKRKYDITHELTSNILEMMKELYSDWVIDFMREGADEWYDTSFIIVIENELHDIKRMMPKEGISFMESLLRDIKIQKIIE